MLQNRSESQVLLTLASLALWQPHAYFLGEGGPNDGWVRLTLESLQVLTTRPV